MAAAGDLEVDLGACGNDAPSPGVPTEAEVAAAAVVNRIIEKGGNEVWKRYLFRQKFVFAGETTTEFILSHLSMCFVPHEPGDKPCEWEIEPDPVAPVPDAWASMQIPVRDAPVWEPKEIRAAPHDRSARRRSQTNAATAYEPPPAKTRASPLPKPDLAFSALEEQWRRDMVKKRIEYQQAKRDARDEDPDGLLNGFGDPADLPLPPETDLSDLPSLIERFKYEILGDYGQESSTSLEDLQFLQRSCESATSGGRKVARPSSAPALPRSELHKNTRSSQQRNAGRKSGEEAAQFTDDFRPLDNWQMRVVNAISVQPGVTLNACGQRRMGPLRRPSGEGKMSWRDYRALSRPHSAAATEATTKIGGDVARKRQTVPVVGTQRPTDVPANPAAVAAALLHAGKSMSATSGSRPPSGSRLQRPQSASTLCSRPRSAATPGQQTLVGQPLIPPSPTARKLSSTVRLQPRSSRIAPLGDPWKQCRPVHGRLLQLAT